MTEENRSAETLKKDITRIWAIVGVVALSAVVLLIIEATFNVFLLLFAGILLAVFFNGLGGLIHRKTHWNRKVCLGISIIGNLLLVVGFFWLTGSEISKQFDELSVTLPKTLEKARSQLEGSTLGDKLIETATSEESSKKLRDFARGFFRSTFGVFGDLYVVLFIGVFLTVTPDIYLNGLIKLVPLKGQKRAREILNNLGQQLRKWIKGKFLSMFVVFVFTAIGLAILGIPLWLVLALLAGLLSFIPNFGPLIALIPAVLVGLMDSPQTALLIAGLYVFIQFVESNFITTLIQQKMVNMPPALILFAQLVLGSLTGGWGLLLSTPLTVVLIVLINDLYIQRRRG